MAHIVRLLALVFALCAGGVLRAEDVYVPENLEPWRAWTALTAVRRGNLFFVPPSLVQRHTPRIAQGARMLCEALELARERRPEPSP